MHEINIADEFGECCEQECPFRSECACHFSAGDFRMEDGFTPQIFFDDEKETFHCATFSELPYDEETYISIPANHDSLDRGFVKIQKP